jgi:hypothetical protein
LAWLRYCDVAIASNANEAIPAACDEILNERTQQSITAINRINRRNGENDRDRGLLRELISNVLVVNEG